MKACALPATVPMAKVFASTDKLLAPPLTKSMWFADGGHLPALARILLKGQTGPIDGVNYGEGLMTPLQNTHSDEEIAQVLSYIGEQWHGWSKPAEAREIAYIRKTIADREQPWTHDELVAWQKARARTFHPIPFGSAATADGRNGVYLAADVASDRVSIRRYGTVQINGIPFSLPDPAGLQGGANLIVLKGGATPNADQPHHAAISRHPGQSTRRTPASAWCGCWLGMARDAGQRTGPGDHRSLSRRCL